MSEMRGLFEYSPALISPLAPLAQPGTVAVLKDMHDLKQHGGRKAEEARKAAAAAAASAGGRRASGGAARKRRGAATDPGAPARVVAMEAKAYADAVLPWLTVIIDEVHDLRNAFSTFGIGGLLVCQQAQRAVLLSGTPFNNRIADLGQRYPPTHHQPNEPPPMPWSPAPCNSSTPPLCLACAVTLGSYIDAGSDLATERYYADCKDAGRAPLTSDFFLRRTKDDLKEKLPDKHLRHVEVRPSDDVRPSLRTLPAPRRTLLPVSLPVPPTLLPSSLPAPARSPKHLLHHRHHPPRKLRITSPRRLPSRRPSSSLSNGRRKRRRLLPRRAERRDGYFALRSSS